MGHQILITLFDHLLSYFSTFAPPIVVFIMWQLSIEKRTKGSEWFFQQFYLWFSISIIQIQKKRIFFILFTVLCESWDDAKIVMQFFILTLIIIEFIIYCFCCCMAVRLISSEFKLILFQMFFRIALMK